MTIMTTSVFYVDVDGIQTRRDADLATARVLRASCSEIERGYWLTEIEAKRRALDPLRTSRRLPN
jgi:hypothetical protein